MKRLALLFIALGQAFAADYYFAQSGSNSNACTLAAPCKTIAKANSIAGAAGDTFRFNGGDTWNTVTDAQLTLSSSGNGTAGSPIVVMSYGTGQAIFDGQGSATQDINIAGKSYITIQNLQIQKGVSNLVYLNNCANCTIQNCTLYDSGGLGVDITGTSPNGIITQNTYSLRTSGFSMQGTALIVDTISSGGSITHNSVDLRNVASTVWPYGILCRNSNNCVIDSNVVYINNGSQGIGMKVIGGATADVTGWSITNNAVVGMYSCCSGSGDGEAIELTGLSGSWQPKSGIVKGNYVQNSPTNASVDCIGVANSSNNTIEYNTCLAGAASEGIHITTGSANNNLYNNTIYGGTYGVAIDNSSNSGVTGNNLYNNLLVKQSSRPLYYTTTATGTYDYNLAYGDPSGYQIGGATDGGHNLTGSGSTNDPKIGPNGNDTVAGANDFKLYSSASAAYHAGTNLGASYNQCLSPVGTSVPFSYSAQDSLWNIGAFGLTPIFGGVTVAGNVTISGSVVSN